MIRRADTTVLPDGVTPEPGIYITVKNGAGALATLFEDDGSALANPIISGTGGAFHYNIDAALAGPYTEEYRLSLADAPRTVNAVFLIDTVPVTVVTANIGAINTVAGAIVNVNAVGTSIANVNIVASDLANINTVAANISNINGAIAAAASASASLSAALVAQSAAQTAQGGAASAQSGAQTAQTGAQTAEAATIAAISGAGGSLGTVTLQAADRTILAALNTASGLQAFLNEGMRAGMFKLVTASAYSTLITADTRQGVIVPSTFDATKAWIRAEYVNSAWLNLLWFGALGDGTADDSPAMTGALAVSGVTLQSGSGYGTPGRPIRAPFGHYRFYSTYFTPAHPVRIVGDGAGNGLGPSTVFEWNDGGHGFAESDAFREAFDFDGILFKGGYAGGAEGGWHAIHTLAKGSIRNCGFFNWSGEGINFSASGGTGNCNGASVQFCFFQGCRIGVKTFAGDANVITVQGCDFEGCRQAGIFSLSFLGCKYDNCEAAECSITSYNDGVIVPISMCTYSGNRYFVIYGQETWASANPPSGNTTDNTGWAYSSAGGVNTGLGIITWFAGVLVRAGSSFMAVGVNSRDKFDTCYHEGGQPFAQMAQSVTVSGGLLAENVWRGNNGSTNNGAVFSSISGQFSCARAIKSRAYQGTIGGTADVIAPQIGENAALTVLAWRDPSHGDTHRIRATGLTNSDFIWDFANLGSAQYFYLTGADTTQQFGTGAAVPYVVHIPRLSLSSAAGFGPATGKQVFRAGTSSATYAAPAGGTTVDTQARASLAQLAADLADMKAKFQAAGQMS